MSLHQQLMDRGFSRRQIHKIAGLITGAAAMPFASEFALAQNAVRRAGAGMRLDDPDIVRISSNENPLGPCPEALEAIYAVAKKGGRYGGSESAEFPRIAAQLEGLKPDYVQPYAGSSDPLFRATLAFVSPTKSFVMGDPGYEAGARAAEFVGAKVHRIPLAKDYSHDVKAMVKADPNAGVLYICNPNNPTGTLTKRADIEWLLANKPKGSILLLDEAYIHFSKDQPGSDLVAKDADVIVLRTFSKAYGMAGIRAGLAFGRPDLLEKMRPYGSGMLPITGMAAAAASLKVKTLVEERRSINARVREDVCSFLAKNNLEFVPSESNKFMLNVKRPGGEVSRAMMQEKIMIGRTWPAWPNHVRVTVGTQAEMDKFKTAILKVMSA